MLWLLVFCVGCVFAMTPIFNSKKSAPLDAGQTDSGTQFTNAPWVQVNTASNPLFTGKSADGISKVNAEVLYDLLSYVNSTSVWNGVTKNNTTPLSGSAYTALTCEDFGKLDTSTKNAQLLVTLFGDIIVNSANNAVQWQAVYRSMNDTSDVLTLYMNDIYKTTSMFDSTGNNQNYLTSDSLRDFVSTGGNSLQSQVASVYGTSHLVAPKDVPSNWQSTANQPDSDSLYNRGMNNGIDDAEDLLWVPSGYEVILREKEIEPFVGVSDSTRVSNVLDVDATLQYYGFDPITDSHAYLDIDTTKTHGRSGLWRMSGYDRAIGSNAWLRSANSRNNSWGRKVSADGDVSTGNVNENENVRIALHLNLSSLVEQQLCKVSANSSFSSGTAPTYEYGTKDLQTTFSTYNYCNYVISNNITAKGSATATFTERNSIKIKSFILKTATNSKTINVDSASGSGTASGVGNFSYTYSGGKLAVTVSNLSASTEIVASDEELILTTNLNIVANNNSVNSLLILTIMDGSTSIAEYSCITDKISISVDLEQKKTYKILATRPFGSRLTVLLDGATLAPTNFACYEISTGTQNAMNLSFELTGDGSWKNCVVV